MSHVTYVDQLCKSVLNRVEGMPFKWSINPYTGCAHACRYCYARAFYLKADKGTAADFDTQIYVKSGAPDVLRAELARRSWRRELVVIGAATDPYQPAEGKFRITRRILEALRDARTPVSIITKNPMVVRDSDLLRQMAETAGAEVHMTLSSMDEQVWKEFEPHAPSPTARIKAVRRLNEAGVRTGVFLAPIMPGINDSESSMRGLMEAAHDAGAPYVVPIALRLQPGVREWFLPFISRHRPQLTIQYSRLYQKVEAPEHYKHRTLGLAARMLQELGLAGRPGKMERTPAQAGQVQQLRLSI